MSDFKPKDFKRRRKITDEIEMLGFSPTAHPLELYDLSGCLEAREMKDHIGRYAWMVGWMIAAKMVQTRQKKEMMKFLSMEDLSATFEVTLFPKAYQKYGHLTQTHGPYRVHGRIESDLGALSLNCDNLELCPLKEIENSEG